MPGKLFNEEQKASAAAEVMTPLSRTSS